MKFAKPIEPAHARVLNATSRRMLGDLQYRSRVHAVVADQNVNGEAALFFPATTSIAGKMSLALLSHPRENWSRVTVYEVHLFNGELFASTAHTYRKLFNRHTRTEVFTRDGKVIRETPLP